MEKYREESQTITLESELGTIVPLYTERKIVYHAEDATINLPGNVEHTNVQAMKDAPTHTFQDHWNSQDEDVTSPEESSDGGSTPSSSIPSSSGAFNLRQIMRANATTLMALSGEWIAIPPLDDIMPFLLRFTICNNTYHSPEDNSRGHLRICNNYITLEGGVLSFEGDTLIRIGKSGKKTRYSRSNAHKQKCNSIANQIRPNEQSV
jgi:hypothetical protein